MNVSALSVLPSDVIRNGLQNVFADKLQSENVKITIESGSKNGDNFIGVVYRAIGEVTGADGEAQPQKMKLILKVAPQSVPRRERFFSRPCFLREMFIYNEVNVQ